MAKKIGVYVCHCGSNIQGRVDCKSVAGYAEGLKDVVVSRDYQFMCSDPGQDLIINDIREYGLSRVVVASCSPRLHEKTFQKACARAGLNPYLMQHACIREHCSWITANPAEATAKAMHIVEAAVERVSGHQELFSREVDVLPDVMVVGGGIAGIQASLDIAKSGHKVHLVEKSPSIGGHMAQFDKTFPTLDCAACISTPKMVAVSQEANINLMTWSEVEDVSGFVGNYTVTVKRKARFINEDICTGCGACLEKCPTTALSEFNEGLSKRKAIFRNSPQAVPSTPVIDGNICKMITKNKCGLCQTICPTGAIDYNMKDSREVFHVGSIVLATGYGTMDPTPISEYGFGKYDEVYTALQFERLNNAVGPTGGQIIMKNGQSPESVAIIHCVGSRDQNYHEYCSRTCCMYALKYDHLIKDKVGHDTKVYNFYIDMRCFGKGYEEFFKRVQEEGVTFIRGRPAEIVQENGKLVVVGEDTLLSMNVRVPVDMVILCTAMQAQDDMPEVARIFGVAQGQDGFFLEEHPKLGPVSTATDGVFLAGACQGPKDIPDAVAHASGGAAQALALAARGKVSISPTTSWINPDICVGCKVCTKLCPYSAIEFDERRQVAVINEAMCKGCGSCAGYCPSGAAQIKHFNENQIFNEIDGLLGMIPDILIETQVEDQA
ncbi:heterodisulfide reductase subunit A [Maridesulfovibrio ferrireducens]|uniref:Heterodisulfide reductase subunit A n=1 Tax=Maridesulfovibrio ferrireducens TaxID=246191 RepID=A0A1G9HCH1_9BACT|nr:CoB--CoM heterodisulfide reductase iron-sulfur subunit A family protein [Maridesulfovibrio ferrireducens]SDL10193.1 heterodisulfide reductase subunit A [Maridesulfovibrio ferrireducens]